MMFEVKGITDSELEKTRKFLLSVSSIDEVDNDVLKNAVIVLDEKRVVGAVSYEIFSNYALVRYFIFQKTLKEDVVKKMFESLINKAKMENIDYLFSIILSSEVESLFKDLEFKVADKSKIFIDEQCFLKTKYKDALFMIRPIS